MRLLWCGGLIAGVMVVLGIGVPAAPERGRVEQFIFRLPSGTASNPIAAARVPGGTTTLPNPSWAAAGATITNRTTTCTTAACNTATSAGTSATAAQINSALASCPSGQVVLLAAGTYNLSGGITTTTSNCTLRGAGPEDSGSASTKLVFTNDVSCGGVTSDLCAHSSTSHYGDAPSNSGTLSGGYTQGSSTLTLSVSAGSAPVTGALLTIDQLADTTPHTDDTFACEAGSSSCANEGGQTSRAGRPQSQLVRVTNVTGSGPYTVTIDPPIAYPNFRSGKSPGAWWINDPVEAVGFEDMQVDHSSSLVGNADAVGTMFFNCYGCWVKNIKSLNPQRAHVKGWNAMRITVRDSYFYGTKDAVSRSYGIETFGSSSYWLIENNILQHITASLMMNSGPGHVLGYNYIFDAYYTAAPTQMMGGIWFHSAGTDYILLEGNDQLGVFSDTIHGTHQFVTVYRNISWGYETGKTSQNNAIINRSYSRFYNQIGNVLGTSGVHNGYENGGTSPIVFENGVGSSATYTVPDDATTTSTLMRWGNYDVVNAAVRWESSEVPSGISTYPNAVPSSHALPNSLYLSAKPAFFGSTTWPPIGPDVTGGNITGVGGFANKIPARQCYESRTLNGSNVATNFNATSCYP